MVTPARAAAFAIAARLCSASGAAARVPAAEDVLTLRELGDYRGGLTISPDGARIAVFERELRLRENDYRYRLLVTPSAGGEARIVADAGDYIVRPSEWSPNGGSIDRPPVWSPDGQSLAYFAMHDGRVELWRVNADGGSPERIVVEPGDVLRFAWLDNNSMVVETGTPRARLAAIIASQETSGFHPDDHLAPYAGLRPAPSPLLSPQQFVVDLRIARQRPATDAERSLLNGPHRPEGAIASDQAPDASLWIAPRTPGDPAMTPRLGLYRSRLDGSDARMCGQPQCTGHMLDVWTFGSHIIFRRMEGWNDGLTALYDWDWASDTVRLVRREDEELFSCQRARGRLLCLQESPRQPRRIVSIDLSTGALRPLYEPNPQWQHFAPPRVERIEVHDAYGNESFAHLVFPVGYAPGQRYPVVIVQYRSRGFLRGGVGDEYPIYPLAGRGYFVLSVDRPEWRGAEANTVPYAQLSVRTELDNSENQMKQSALEAMLAELNRRGLSDPAHIGITGLSDGAETVYWAITESNLFAAAVTSSPPTDSTTWTMGAAAYLREIVSEGGDGPSADPETPWGGYWRRNITALHADAIHAPLLMNLPESEAITGFPLATRLRELHRPVDVYVYPGAFHIKWRPAQILASQHRAMDWLDFWLRGIEREDPEDPGRLTRWRALRDDGASHR